LTRQQVPNHEIIASIDYLNATIKRLEMTKIKDSINYDRGSGIDEQCISYMAVCQPSSREGMNLTPNFIFDTLAESFPLYKNLNWQRPAKLIVVRQIEPPVCMQ
jgi:hypothetical protein